MGCLFLLTYSLALGDPVAHRIDGAVVGDATAHPQAVRAVEDVAGGKLALAPYPTRSAALAAIADQKVYAALDLTSARPTLYVASAAGASVARVLERVAATDSGVRVVDAHPLAMSDPSGLDVFYRMLIATILGMLAVFQLRANVASLPMGARVVILLGLALVASLAFTLIGGLFVGGFVLESWGVLALHIVAVTAFASLMGTLLGRWAIIPTWLFFVIFGNTSSGGAVAPPLLPQPFAFLSEWLPSGSTVTALREALYFQGHQHARPIVVLSIWAVSLFSVWVIVARRSGTA
jgi:hypothetical protein